MKYFVIKLKLSTSLPDAANETDLLQRLSRYRDNNGKSIEEFIKSANISDTWEDDRYLVTMSSKQTN